MVEGLCLTRRVNQLARKEYRPRQSASEATGSSTEKDEELALNDWDKWFENDKKLNSSKADESDFEMLD